MNHAQELSHREFVEIVTEYFEGALSAADRRRFEQHFAHCAGCAAYLEQMRETIRLVGALGREALPAPAWRELLHAFRDWKAGRNPAD